MKKRVFNKNITKLKITNIRKKKNIKDTKTILHIFRLILLNNIFLNLFISILTNDAHLFHYIILKFNKTGSIKVFNDNNDIYSSYLDIYPSKVYINQDNQTTIMSEYYKSERINEVKLIWENYINSTSYLFYNCPDIIEIDFSNFDSSHLERTDYMFKGCSSLKYINFSNFDASKITFMTSMFDGCSSLISLNLSSFYTSLLNKMGYMFNGCSSLVSIDLSSFDTSGVKSMERMFCGCSSLISLDLSNFDAFQLINMGYMFSGCTSLKSIDLSNFYTSKVTNIAYLFNGCSSLQYINLKNSNINEENFEDIEDYKNIFDSTPENLFVYSELEIWKNWLSGYNHTVKCIKGDDNNEFVGFKKNLNEEMKNDYVCKICGNNFYSK